MVSWWPHCDVFQEARKRGWEGLGLGLRMLPASYSRLVCILGDAWKGAFDCIIGLTLRWCWWLRCAAGSLTTWVLACLVSFVPVRLIEPFSFFP
jgi:hypothetical protein